MNDDNYGNLANKFSVAYTCSRYTKEKERIWDVELTDHNQTIWKKELVCHEPPPKEDIIKSYWIDKNSFNEVFLTIQESRELEDFEKRALHLKRLREERKNFSDKKNAAAAHNITFQQEPTPNSIKKIDNAL